VLLENFRQFCVLLSGVSVDSLMTFYFIRYVHLFPIFLNLFHCFRCSTVMCTKNGIISTQSALPCNWSSVHCNDNFAIFYLFSCSKFVLTVSCVSNVVLFHQYLSYIVSFMTPQRMKKNNINVSLIKLVLPKIKMDATQKRLATRTHRHPADPTNYWSDILLALLNLCIKAWGCAEGVSQVLAGRTSILLMSLYQSWYVLSPRQQKAFHLSDNRNNHEEGAASSCPQQ
jgi:hypothetical protein